MDSSIAAAGIVAAGLRLGARGLISAGEGNLSVRLDGDRVAVTPSGRRKDELSADDIVVVTIGPGARDARSVSGLGPSSDLAIHLAVYAARPDIGAVAHAHLPASMALTLGGEIPDPAALPETALLIPRLPFVPFGEMGSDELAARVATVAVGGSGAASRTWRCSSVTARSRSGRTPTRRSIGSSWSRSCAGRGATACSSEPPVDAWTSSAGTAPGLDRPGSIGLAQTVAVRQRTYVEGSWTPASTWRS